MATTVDPPPAALSEETGGPTKARGWGTEAPDEPLRPMDFERRALRPDDVAIRITYAGICHSDLHTARNDWGGTQYPVIPGHEIVGTVTAVGDEVTRHRVGDTVAVGCMVDSCMTCDQCLEGWEVFCREGCVQTYNSPDRHDGSISKGGYTDHIVVRDHFVCKVPAGMDASQLGAHDVIVSTDAEAMAAAATRFDFILNTVPVSHEIDGYLQLLGRSGRMVIVGALTPMPGFTGFNLIWWNRAVGGSAIGGIPETQEMLDFCAERGIYPDCEMIRMDQVNEAYERLLRNDVRYRFVIDGATIGAPA